MPQESPTSSDITELVIRPVTGLATLPDGGSPALAEIISRSLAHIRTNPALVVNERRAGDEREFEIAPGVSIVMCWIPAGEFLMGSPEDEDGRWPDEIQHLTQITQGFWMAKTPTTQAQWQAGMGTNPSHFKGRYLPVEKVSWNDICGDESRTGGFLGAINRMASGGERFDLPTEAQWEYACRAGFAGACAGDLDLVAWYDQNSGGKTHPVGTKQANGWGLHDMLGNVWEWCADWFDGYPDGVVTDPVVPALNSTRLWRGGSWSNGANDCRAAFRSAADPPNSYFHLGFRVVRNSVS